MRVTGQGIACDTRATHGTYEREDRGYIMSANQLPESPSPRPRPTAVAPVDEVSVVRSREQLSAVTQRVPVAVARLEKFVVTEQRTITVDVAREDVRLVYGPPPATDTVAGTASPAPPDKPRARADTVTLFAQEIEIIRRWVPVETARLAITTVSGVETVTDTVRSEHVDTTIEATAVPDNRDICDHR